MAKSTICSDCGKEFNYITKKPQRCETCADKFKYSTSKVPWNRSKLEYQVQDWLDTLFPEPTYHYLANGFYSWLRSPKNKPLQLDFLIYQNGRMLFAVEIDGKQHFEKAFWQTEEQHVYLQDCDLLKARALREINVPLIRMKNIDEDWTIEKFIGLLDRYGIEVKNPADMVLAYI